MSVPADISAIYEKALAVDGKYPYAYGGGHGASFAPSAPIGGAGPFGYDCGSFLSMLVHAGAPQEMPRPVATHELESWELEGPGEYLTVHVFDGRHEGHVIEHCVLEFPRAVPEHRYAMAFHTGGPHCGFVAAGGMDVSFYRHRRKQIG